MTTEVNGRRLLSAEVTEPRVGAWHADLEYDPEGPEDTALTGLVTFKIEDVAWSGTVIRSGVSGGRGRARVVGGAGGLSRQLLARDYTHGGGVQVSTVLRDLLRDAGETLSSTAEAAVTGGRVSKWQRAQAPASHALVSLLDAASGTWRVLRNGTIWVGAEAWPPAPDFAHVLVDEDWAAGILTLAPEAPVLEPSTTFRGHRLELVVHRLTGGKLRTEAHTNSLSSSLDKFLAGIRRGIDYSRLYPARVTRQNADGTLELVPDSDTLSRSGLDKVPIRHGLPGITVRNVPDGARVRVGFEAGRPDQAFALLWDADSGASSQLVLHVDTLKLGGEEATNGIPLGPALLSWLNAHTHPTGVGPSGPPVIPADPGLLSTSITVKP